MARWARRTKRIPAILRHHLVHSLDRRACRSESRFPRLLRRHRVLIIEISDHFIARPLQLGDVLHHFLDVIEVVNLQYVCQFGPFIHLWL